MNEMGFLKMMMKIKVIIHGIKILERIFQK